MHRNEIEKGIDHLRKNDPILKPLTEKIPPYWYEPREEYAKDLITAILNQQLSIKAAYTIEQRFLKKFGDPPDLTALLEADHQDVRALGLSNAKVTYVKAIASAFLNEEVHFHKFPEMSDEEIIKELVKIKGVGEWTAHMFLMFTLIRPNVLPVGDLGIKRAIMINYDLPEMPDAKTVAEISRKGNWAPYNTIACYYLWKSIDQPGAASPIY
ncbi:MAG: DNA-3-methyladenine glycosylase 2 family protein [Ignavibacteria bacterium]|nr:DNA-3-methyladenine glycosylase 2 family protein [Ignavibacteria bacterium]